MIYLAIFWVLMALFAAVYFLAKWKKQGLARRIEQEYGSLFFILAASFLIIAIVTNDPVTVAGIAIPTEIQWLASLLVTGFGSWKFYLNPLKERVIRTEIEASSIKADVSTIKADVSMIKQALMKHHHI